MNYIHFFAATCSVLLIACGGGSSSSNERVEEPIDPLVGFWQSDDNYIRFTKSQIEIWQRDTYFDCSIEIYDAPYDWERTSPNSFQISLPGVNIDYTYALNQTSQILEFNELEYSALNPNTNINSCASESRTGYLRVTMEFENLPSDFLTDFSWTQDPDFEIDYSINFDLADGGSLDLYLGAEVESGAISPDNYQFISYSLGEFGEHHYFEVLSDIEQSGNSLIFTINKAAHPAFSEPISEMGMYFIARYSTTEKRISDIVFGDSWFFEDGLDEDPNEPLQAFFDIRSVLIEQSD